MKKHYSLSTVFDILNSDLHKEYLKLAVVPRIFVVVFNLVHNMQYRNGGDDLFQLDGRQRQF